MDFVTLGVVLGLATNVVCLLLIALLFRGKFLDKTQRTQQAPRSPFREAPREWNSPEISRSATYTSPLHFMAPKQIHRINVTGGPCADKTTAMTQITERVRELGLKVYVVPEAATLFMKDGAMINMEDFSRVQKVRFQAKLMRLQMVLEDVFTDLCNSSLRYSSEKALVLCDRGVIDGSAYIQPELWQALVDELGFSVVHLRDRRYDAAVHKATAARGAKDYYNISSNEARNEGLDEARHVDELIQKAWTGQPDLTIIDNSYPTFDAKLNKSAEQVCMYFGLPTPLLKYKKYLVLGEPNIPSDLPNIKR